MAEERALELQVFLPSEEVISPAKIPGAVDNVTGRQDDGCGVREEENESQRVGTVEEEESEKDDLDKAFLMEVLEFGTYEIVQAEVTATALLTYSNNPFLLAVKVAEKLHARADKETFGKYDFINLASSVEEFTLRLLDVITNNRLYFYLSCFPCRELDVFVETATATEQKKVLNHTAIIDHLNFNWYGHLRYRRFPQFFLFVWCIFDAFLFPLKFLLTLGLGKSKSYFTTYFKIPLCVFIREMISYLVLLALHLAICVEPSKLSFSGLEWAILVFFTGRLLTEMNQIIDVARKPSEHRITGFSLLRAKLNRLKFNYIRDRWNVFDLLILVIYIFVLLPLRIVTWVDSESVNNNTNLAIAGYLYGFNTMLLTFRAFGSILEKPEGIGTIQIAFFHIIGDAVLVVLHFLVMTLAFASAITKVFETEKTMASEGTSGKQPVCQKSGLQCWWKIATHLGWSLLDLSEGLSPLESTDPNSEALAQLLFAAYLVLTLIMLINMLIALLSNTYQRVQDNSRNEWLFKKAIAVQTYRNYHPIPVPFNIFSIPALSIYKLCKGKAEETDPLKGKSLGKRGREILLEEYRLKYGDSFPSTNKIDEVLDDAENTERMVNQIHCRTFTCQKGHDKALLPTGSEAWQAHKSLLVEDYLITCLQHDRDDSFAIGARYKVAFSGRFPHFEVMILESAESKCIALGVVFEDVGTQLSLGKEGTVGYHTKYARIHDSSSESGSRVALRGNVIRCTVLFEKEQEVDGKIQVPVVFSVNGGRIDPIDKHQSFIEYSKDRPLFPYVAFYKENRVLAKMCAREDVDYQGQEINSRLDKIGAELGGQEIKSRLDEIEAKFGQEMKSRLAEVESKLECFDKKINGVRECCEKNLSMMETLLKKNKRIGKETIMILRLDDTNIETEQCTAFDFFAITVFVHAI